MLNKKYEEVEKEFWDKLDKQIQSRIFEKEKSGETAMKREIEFRGKTAKGEWVYGYYYKTKALLWETEQQEDWILQNDCYNIVSKHPVIPETVGQYTGIKDKNGKKVYVGDIVKTEQGRIGNICFNDGAFCFNVENKYIYALCDSEFGYVYKENADELEVIGTVFDKES